MKKFDLKKIPGLILTFIKNRLPGKQNGSTPKYIADTTHMQKREEGSKLHFLYVLLFGLGMTSALWQHGSPAFTLLVLALLLPAAFLLYVPYSIADTLLRQLLSCSIFFGACLWSVIRLKREIPFDLALVEGMILISFAFLVNCTRKDYHYLFFISLFLLIYAGLVPRPLLLFLIPGAVLTALVIFLAEREQYLSGTRKTVYPPVRKRFRSFLRSWHLILLQLVIAFPVFLYVFSLIPLEDTGNEGLFEVSFATARRSVMPPDLKAWLGQNKKAAKNPEGDTPVTGDKPEVAGTIGKKIDAPSEQNAMEEGGGRAAPPGKDLLFTAVMPAKLYHLATLYDEYDGRTWRTSEKLQNSKTFAMRTNRHVYFHDVSVKYTIKKWISPRLYAPFRPRDYQHLSQLDPSTPGERPRFFLLFQKLNRTSFSAVLKENPYPQLPFTYAVTSDLFIPLPPTAPPKPGEKQSMPELNPSAAEVFYLRAGIAREQEAKRQAALKKAQEAREKARIAREKARLAREKALKAKREALKKAAEKRRQLLAHQRKKGKLPPKSAVKKTAVKKPVQKKPAAAKIQKKAVKKVPPKVPPKKIVRSPKRPPRRPPRDFAWLENIPQSHYLQLPEKLSPRIAALAKNITAGLLTPYEKAIALRNYLRENYKYRLYADPTPEGKESVEYFLFELKEGHCEYFAAALTLLARSVELPARVATGFSPGNYNALTKEFEVFEYHAHAWSQIFISQAGWLTFDAVPPGDIVSETTPVGIGRLRDPFGDDWKVMPPEISEKLLTSVKERLEKEKKREDETKKNLSKDPSQGKKHPAPKTIVKQEKKTKKSPPGKTAPPAERIKYFFNDLAKKAAQQLFQLLTSPAGRHIAGGCILVIFLYILLFRRISKALKMLFYRWRFRRLLIKAQARSSADPAQSVLALYRAVRLLLLLAGMERKHNQELLAYAGNAGRQYLKKYRRKRQPAPADHRLKSLEFTACIRSVFTAFYALEYGGIYAEEEISFLYRQTRRTWELLRELQPDGFFFMEKYLFRSPFPPAEEQKK